MLRRILLVAAVLASLTPSASAGIFSRKPKPNPAERVPELLIQLKTSGDESSRSNAAEELRQFDPKAYPEIMTSLIAALSQDASAGVRAEAAASIGRLRPISQQAGYALEQAQSNDASMRVRLAARQALLQYRFVGYRSGGRSESSVQHSGAQTTSASSPLTGMVKPPPPTRVIKTPQGVFRETAEPPLADPPMAIKPDAPVAPVARSKGSTPAQVIPSPPPELLPVPKPPAAKSEPPSANDGPVLPPQS